MTSLIRPPTCRRSFMSPKEDEKALLEAASPFLFSAVKAGMILRFLKLIAYDNDELGPCAGLVDDCNQCALRNGITCSSTGAALHA
jgi:hypothetical protein